ncbi:MAG: tRNA (cytidine(34)-2'-O)-methyltransferase [Pseudomonadota bacterium]
MFHIVLFEPEIPGNTGNIIRLAANTGSRLHLVKPLGFSLDEKSVRRSGLDYHELADLNVHENWQAVRAALAGANWHAFTTRAGRLYAEASFRPGDVLAFGPESRGLPVEILREFDDAHRLKLPMQPGCRSLNLSNAVSVAVYEAWRQNGFGL